LGALRRGGTLPDVVKILTQYASHANTIADTFRAAFMKTKVGTHTVEMTAPTDSTKGGLLALQHVTLKPETGMALVVGTVNAGEKRAELRSYAHVSKVNEDRFKRPLPFDEASYETFLDKAEAVLGAFGIDTKVTDAPRDMAPSFADTQEGKPAPRSSGTMLIAVVIVLLALASAAGWFIMRR
jgi:hypothetical protein